MTSIEHLTIQRPAPTDEDLPTVTLGTNVLEKIFTASMEHITHETGEAMVGLAFENENQKLPTLYILDTVPPMQHSIRQFAMFEQGDDVQGAIFNWWYENWELYREIRRKSYGNSIVSKWDVPLQHIGDWHKQPDGMIRPSGGDMRTAKQFMKEMDIDFLLLPIATFEPTIEPLETVNTVAIATENQRLRIDFWWVGRKGNNFELVKPILSDDVPRLPEIVWWLKDSSRLDAEIAALEAANIQVLDIVSWSENKRPPLDTCFLLYKTDHQHVWIAVTDSNYPARQPKWFSAPLMRPEKDQDFFMAVYEKSEAVPPNVIKEWTAETSLLDAAQAVEAWEKNKS